jgi:DNA-binding NtrC family response regulator
MTGRVLVVDNDEEMVLVLRRELEHEGQQVTGVHAGAAALAALRADPFDVIVTDLIMEDVDGLAVLREARAVQPAARVILMTAFASVETAIQAMRDGAFDYLMKPFRLAEATIAVGRAVDDIRLREENRRLRQHVDRRLGVDGLLGRSKPMQEVFEQIEAVARSDAPVLLAGESGTGKELVARALHWNSDRRDGPFIAVNCAAIPAELLESELFGHEKGSFTGATARRPGLFVEASGGTLLLDEVGDIPAGLQPKLLRALQEKLVRPVGATREIATDFRLISATHRDLTGLVRDGRFREDLYYRIAVIPIRLPALRERSEDIMLLAENFLRAAAPADKGLTGFDAGATQSLLKHRWPGNVRELENAIQRSVALARGPLITADDLHIEFGLGEMYGGGVRPTLAELEAQYIQRVLEETKGDKTAAARILGVSVRTLQRRFE